MVPLEPQPSPVLGEPPEADGSGRSSGERPRPGAFAPQTPKQRLRLSAMLRQHFQTVWRTARRLGLSPLKADDAAQEVFITAARKLDQIESGRERRFLISCTVRVAANLRRARHNQAEVSDDWFVAGQPDAAPLADEILERKQLRQLLDEVLDQLPLELRSVFVLYELEGLSGPEIAELLDLPGGTVASRLRRAREVFETSLRRARARREFHGGEP